MRVFSFLFGQIFAGLNYRPVVIDEGHQLHLAYRGVNSRSFSWTSMNEEKPMKMKIGKLNDAAVQVFIRFFLLVIIYYYEFESDSFVINQKFRNFLRTLLNLLILKTRNQFVSSTKWFSTIFRLEPTNTQSWTGLKICSNSMLQILRLGSENRFFVRNLYR